MKYVITGGAGNISKLLIRKLLDAGNHVKIIGRNVANLKELTDAGAVAAIGGVEDADFLSNTFKGADAVYTMVPPRLDVQDLKAHIGSIGENYATAIRYGEVKFVVNLSSVGGHLAEGAGPVSGLYRVEQALNKLEDVSIKHLRPSYFYQNLFSNIDLIRQAGIMGGNFSVSDNKFPLADARDIADAAAQALLNLDFNRHTVQYIASDEVSTDSIASAIGNAIGKPDLKWIVFADDQAFQGMVKAGLPEEVAKNYIEMNQAINRGSLYEDYWKHRSGKLGKIKLNDFAHEFAARYNAG